MQVIPYNPGTDPNQYLAQMVQNLLNPMLQQRDFSQLARYSQGGMAGQAPMLTTQTGQNVMGQLLLNRPRIEAERARAAYWKTQQAEKGKTEFQKLLDEGYDKGTAKQILDIKYKLKPAGDELSEKDINTILKTLNEALAATYSRLGEELPGEKMGKNRQSLVDMIEYYSGMLKGRQPKQTTTKKPEPEKKAFPDNDPLGFFR